MSETPPEPPGSTATHTGPAGEQNGPREQHQASTGARQGIDTENLRDYRALRRDAHERKIAGVSGGLARHLDIDPTLVRVVMVVLALFGGAGLVLYAALWLFVPEQGSGRGLIPVGETARNAIIVVALILAVVVALPAGFDGDGGVAVPVLVLTVILVAVLMSRDSARRTAASPAPPGATAWEAGPVPPPVQHRPGKVRRGPILFGLALASVVLALGLLGMVEASGSSVPDAAYAALTLAVIGAWLVVGSVYGRPGGLVLAGVISLLALSATSVVEPTFEGERDLMLRPASVSQLDSTYDLPAGRAEIDLRGIRDLEALDGRTLAVSLNAGEIVLIVPAGLAVDLDARVSAGGEISTPELDREGWGAAVDRTVLSDDSRATLVADLQVGFGRIHVRSE